MLLYLVVLLALTHSGLADTEIAEAGDIKRPYNAGQRNITYSVPKWQCTAEVTPEEMPCSEGAIGAVYSRAEATADGNIMEIQFTDGPDGPLIFTRYHPCIGVASVIVSSNCYDYYL